MEKSGEKIYNELYGGTYVEYMLSVRSIEDTKPMVEILKGLEDYQVYTQPNAKMSLEEFVLLIAEVHQNYFKRNSLE